MRKMGTSWLNRNGFPISRKYVHSIAHNMVKHGVTDSRYREVVGIWHQETDHHTKLIKHNDAFTKNDEYLVDLIPDIADVGMIAKNHFVHALRLFDQGGMFYEHMPNVRIWPLRGACNHCPNRTNK